MGLRYFHFVFIATAILCTVSFGFWAMFTGQDVVNGWGRLGGAASALLGGGLIAYLVWFLRESKGIAS